MTTRRTLGYVQNEWICPNCNTRNKGGSKTCSNCGAPQPENVQFELPTEQQFVTEQEQIKAAQEARIFIVHSAGRVIPQPPRPVHSAEAI